MLAEQRVELLSTPTPVTPTPTPVTPTPTPVTPTPTPVAFDSVQDVVEYALPSIVRVIGEHGTGSGFIYHVEGARAYIATNEHVLADSNRVIVRNSGEDYEAIVLGTDAGRDLAVLGICCASFKPLTFSSLGAVPGQEVVAVGYALGFDGPPTVTSGIVSAMRGHRDLNVDVIQIDAALNSGNSGGPLLTMTGEVLGMNTLKIGGFTESVGFAIVADAIRMRAAALAAPDKLDYDGDHFKLQAGPADVRGVKGGGLVTSWVEARNFVAEVTLYGSSPGAVFAMLGSDDRDPVIESISLLIPTSECRRGFVQRDGESNTEVVPSTRLIPRAIVLRVRLAVVDDRATLYVNDFEVCDTRWEFGRTGWVALGTVDESHSYQDFRVYIEASDDEANDAS